MIERLPNSHRYEVTERGYRVALWLSRCQARVLRPSLSQVLSSDSCFDQRLSDAIERFDKQVARYFNDVHLRTAA
jgi:hypothetical protein